jgi:Flp pilus assembly protein TadG
MDRRRSTGPRNGSAGFLSRFARARSGAVAIWFAVMALPLAVLSFALIDINRASVEKRHLQDALDAATLLAARSTADTDNELQVIGEAALRAQLAGVSDATLTSSSFRLVGTKIESTAYANLTPYISNLWLQGDMEVGVEAEVARASTNLELALVLDITGSMSGTPLADLKTAAKDLIDYVVQDVQTPYYSKAAIVPYSVGVNVGSYASNVRGAVIGTRSITDISWQSGASKTISGISKANPAVVTSTGHGFQNGDVVYISGVKGMEEVNDRIFTVAGRTANTFQLSGEKSSKYDKYKSGGTIRKCTVADCSMVVTTASAHGYADGDEIYFSGVGGFTDINDEIVEIDTTTSTTFSLDGYYGPTSSAWTSGGTAYCTTYGCEYFRFTNASPWSSASRTFQISTCATERTGAQAYTDVAPSSAPVGMNYPSSSNPCPSAQITPLTTDRTALKSKIDSFSAAGSTAGQIGTAWGWYMISPEFAYLWPAASQPAAYNTPDLLKVVVIMTDGNYNTAYCEGVIAKNSGSGSGDAQDKNNCPATNGDATAQAEALCTAMKAKGVIVYTVGFNVGKGSDAEDVMEACATSSNHVYLPSSGAALKDAFAAIGRDLMKLRLSR